MATKADSGEERPRRARKKPAGAEAPKKPAAGRRKKAAAAPEVIEEKPVESAAAKKIHEEREGGRGSEDGTRERSRDVRLPAKIAFRPGPLFAVVRVRGLVGVNRDIADTLRMLRLDRINHCVIVPKNPNFLGMLEKARYFITWGEINRETLEKLVAKRGRFAGDKRVTDGKYVKELAELMISGKKASETGIKPVFRLSPPSKGYESTKVLYPRGSLGYRGEKINELLKRMI